MLEVLIATAVTSFLWLAIVKRYDGNRRFSYSYLITVGLLAGGFSVGFTEIMDRVYSEIFNLSFRCRYLQNPFFLLFSSYMTGFLEEIAKFSSLLLVWGRSRYQPRHVIDIIVLGMVVSMGFETWENILYGYHYDWQTVIVRSLVPGHMIYGAIWSFGFKEYIDDNGRAGGTQLFVASYVLAALMHGTFNFILSLGREYSFAVAIIFAWGATLTLHIVILRLKSNHQMTTSESHCA